MYMYTVHSRTLITAHLNQPNNLGVKRFVSVQRLMENDLHTYIYIYTSILSHVTFVVLSSYFLHW